MFGRTARDTFFLSRFPTKYLPYMFILIAIAIAITIAIHAQLSKRFSFFPLMITTFVLGAISYLFIQLFLFEWMYPVLYVWFEVIGTIMMIQFWLFANSAFDTREAKRLFGVIASGGAVANTALGFSMGKLVDFLTTDFLLPATALFIGLSLLMILYNKQFLGLSATPTRRTLHRSNKKKHGVLSSSYLKVMTLTIITGAVVGALVDYQMKIITLSSFTDTVSLQVDEAGMSSLFGSLYGSIGLVSILIQFFFTSRFLSRFGVLLALMFLPGILLIGSSAILLVPVLATAVGAKAGDQIFRFTLHDVSSQLLWLPVSPQEKSRAKPFIDGTIKNLAGGLTGILILGLMSFSSDVRVLSIPSIILLILWIIANFKLKKGYLSELRKAVEKRRLDFEELEFDYTDPAIVEILHKTLIEGNEHQQLFTLETLRSLPLTAWKNDLRQLLKKGPPDIQKKILELTKDTIDIIPNETIIDLVQKDAGELTTDALLICGHRKLSETLPLMRELTKTNNPSIRAAAATGLQLIGGDDLEEGVKILNTLFIDPEAKVRLTALLTIGHLPNVLPEETLLKLFSDNDAEVRRKAVDLIAKRPTDSAIPHLVSNLQYKTTALAARRALRLHDPEQVLPALSQFIESKKQNDVSLSPALRCLGDLDTPDAVNILLNTWPNTSLGCREIIATSLSKIARRGELKEEDLVKSETLLKDIIRQTYELEYACTLFQEDSDAVLVSDLFAHQVRQMKIITLRFALLSYPEAPISTFAHAVTTPGSTTMANVLEYLDNVLAKDLREKIVSLLDNTTVAEKVEVGTKYYNITSKSIVTWLTELLSGSRIYPSAVAFDYVLQTRTATEEGVITDQWLRELDSPLHWEILAKKGTEWRPDGLKDINLISREDDSMYTTLEKTIFLKGVELFEDIPGEEVAHIAQIAETIHFSPNEIIFKDGDPGDAMFIIVDGKVHIHKEEKHIATLGNAEFVGEMAILDQEPRSASATTQEETVLLRISSEDFFDLMASRMDIVQGIMRVLTRRLREAIA